VSKQFKKYLTLHVDNSKQKKHGGHVISQSGKE
jgi:hypothetical protein